MTNLISDNDICMIEFCIDDMDNVLLRKNKSYAGGFNMSKTKCMYVAKVGRNEAKLTINGNTAQQVRNLKILGRTITMSLTVRDHVETTFTESRNNVNLLKMLAPIKSGLHPHVALNIYKACIRS